MGRAVVRELHRPHTDTGPAENLQRSPSHSGPDAGIRRQACRMTRRAWRPPQSDYELWYRFDSGSWSKGGWDAQLFESCIARTQTLAQPKTFSDRRPTPAPMREFVAKPVE